jgi:hypothetical protein
MDALPVALCELNGNTFQSTGGRTAKLLGKCGLHQAKSKVWGHEEEWLANQRDRPMVNLRIKIHPGRIVCTVQVNISKV